MREKIRECRFSPYRKGYGPTFTLRMFATDKFVRCSYLVAYELLQHENGNTTILFSGEDFSPSIIDADDSDASVVSLMGFLTVRPGDTDDEYFEEYSDIQLEYCDNHAEMLGFEISCRFPNEE